MQSPRCLVFLKNILETRWVEQNEQVGEEKRVRSEGRESQIIQTLLLRVGRGAREGLKQRKDMT